MLFAEIPLTLLRAHATSWGRFRVRTKAVCGALLVAVALASGACMAQTDPSGGTSSQVSVITYKGDRASTFLPAYRAQLQQESQSSEPAARSRALKSLDAITKNKILTYKVEIRTSGTTPSDTQPIKFPSNPTVSDTVSASVCTLDASTQFFVEETDKWEYFGSGKGWINVSSEWQRVAACPPI
jgi:hypothetical protein